MNLTPFSGREFERGGGLLGEGGGSLSRGPFYSVRKECEVIGSVLRTLARGEIERA